MGKDSIDNRVKVLIKAYRHFLAPIVVIKADKKSKKKKKVAHT